MTKVHNTGPREKRRTCIDYNLVGSSQESDRLERVTQDLGEVSIGATLAAVENIGVHPLEEPNIPPYPEALENGEELPLEQPNQ